MAPMERADNTRCMKTSNLENSVLQPDALNTQRRTGPLELSSAKESDDAQERTRMRFLNNMSHEFRTPLSVIIGMTRMALKSATDAKQAGQLDKVQHAAEHLLMLVTNMLELTLLQSRQLQLAHAPFQLGAVLDSLQQSCAKEAQKKGLALAFDAPSGLRALVLQGDQFRLGQILLEMTDNAIKFTGQGRVDVRVKLVGQTASEVVLCFEVQDSGIGITVADQKRIFDLFVQLDDSSTRAQGGTGLGLTLCKQLLELMGGHMGIVSQSGLGSVFFFTLHLARA